MEPWQVLVKATTTGLRVQDHSEHEDGDGLHLNVRLFGYMDAWQKFTTSGYTPEQVEAAVRAWVEVTNDGLRKSFAEWNTQVQRGDKTAMSITFDAGGVVEWVRNHLTNGGAS